MRLVLLLVGVFTLAGCDAVLGISDHPVAAGGGGLDGGLSSETDAASLPDSAPSADGAADSGDAGNPGGPVAAVSCANDGGPCVFGGIFSVGRATYEASTGSFPDGGMATVTDDGFEFGNTTCDPTGVTCVTGAITP